MAFNCYGCGAALKSKGSIGAHSMWNPQCTPAMRFWGRVDKGPHPKGCWLWKGRLDALGYGRCDRHGPKAFSHRAAWIFVHGDIPAGKDLMHSCDVRGCVNPEHLALCTAKENSIDMWNKGRSGKKNVLSYEAVRAIRSAPPEVTNVELAQQYSSIENIISSVRRRKKYAWVPD